MERVGNGNMKSSIIFAVACVLLLSLNQIAYADGLKYKEGLHFTRFEKAIKIPSDSEAIKTEKFPIMEFFSYGCVHCKTFSLFVDKWESSNYLKIHYIPVVWSESSELYAKVFYLAKQQNNFSELHSELFDLVLGFDRTASIDDRTIEIIEWFSKKGVQPIDTLNALAGAEIEEKLAQSILLVKKFKVMATPTLVIDEQYRINNDSVKNQQEILNIAFSILGNENVTEK